MTHLPPFPDRHSAGFELAARLDHLRDAHPVLLGLARGGIPVAEPISNELGVPLDVMLVRKIGVPWDREYGVGAVCEGGELDLDPEALKEFGLTPAKLSGEVAAERAELERRGHLYRGDRPIPDLRGRTVILVDDGIATGGSARAAVRAARTRGATRVVFAAPVGTPQAAERLRQDADEVIVLTEPPDLRAVSDAYESFEQVSDHEVQDILTRHRNPIYTVRRVIFHEELPS